MFTFPVFEDGVAFSFAERDHVLGIHGGGVRIDKSCIILSEEIEVLPSSGKVVIQGLVRTWRRQHPVRYHTCYPNSSFFSFSLTDDFDNPYFVRVNDRDRLSTTFAQPYFSIKSVITDNRQFTGVLAHVVT